MVCKKILPDVALLLEGDLPPDKLTSVEEHLMECAFCRNHYTQHTLLKNLLSEKLTRFIPESALIENLRFAISQES